MIVVHILPDDIASQMAPFQRLTWKNSKSEKKMCIPNNVGKQGFP